MTLIFKYICELGTLEFGFIQSVKHKQVDFSFFVGLLTGRAVLVDGGPLLDTRFAFQLFADATLTWFLHDELTDTANEVVIHWFFQT